MLKNSFKNNSAEIIRSHGETIDKTFKFIIENCIPKFTYRYFKLIDSPVNLTFEDLKKYHKLTKYQQTEFNKEKSPSLLDELLLRFNPNKKQFNFITKVQNLKEREIKLRLQGALKLLFDAREEIRKSSLEMIALRKILIKSKIFSDAQLIKGLIKEIKFTYCDVSPYDILNIKKQTKELEIDLSDDPICGHFVRKHTRKSDRLIKVPFTIYSN